MAHRDERHRGDEFEAGIKRTGMMQAADEQLLVLVGTGDSSAFGMLYDRYAGRVMALLLHLLRDHRDADDVLQETFWQVWRTAASYDAGRANPVAWMLLIARSRALDALRRRGRKPMHELQTEPSSPRDPVTHLETLELGDRVRDALARLSDDQRQAIQLSYYGGLSHQEIADKLSIPLGTAKTRIRQGMLKLRDLLGGLARESQA